MLISTHDVPVKEEKQSTFYCFISDEKKKKEYSDLMKYSDFI